MRCTHWLAALALAAAVPLARAETVYVIEQLVVGVSSTADDTGERVASIKSGDKVELIERVEEQAHIRLPSGAEGWVKASYLSSDPPLQQRLDARTQEVTKLKAEVTRLESELKAVRLAATAAPAPAPAPPPSAPVADANPGAAPSPGNRGMFKNEPRLKAGPPWRWIAAVGAGGLLLGFVLGWRMLDRRIRAKYGGLRIY
ncbi:MAG TPA: hypothetical protein VNB23_02260 [Ramlibacter sp.]|nr:hypothetical protein [Ramlibacter sp.]